LEERQKRDMYDKKKPKHRLSFQVM